MNVTLDFNALSDADRDDLAERLLAAAERKGLAVRLPERRMPYTVAEAAVALNVSKGTVYNLIEAGRLRVVAGLSVKMVVAASLDGVRQGKS